MSATLAGPLRFRLLLLSLLALIAAIASALAASPSAESVSGDRRSGAVPAGYFSTHLNFSHYGAGNARPAKLEKALRGIRAARFREIRVIFGWTEMEPREPLLGIHLYKWDNFDRYVRVSAEHGIRAKAVLGYPPRWASTDPDCSGRGNHGGEPKALGDWAASVEAFVKRYGAGGSFWELNPNLPELPIRSFEISNEPNLDQFWCPRPDPDRYADFLALAAGAIHGRDGGAEVIFGGLIKGENMPASDPSMTSAQFFRRTFRARPSLVRQIDAVGIHLYEFKRVPAFFDRIATFRRELRRAGVPDSIPMAITETGWLRRPSLGYTEARRTRFYRAAIRRIPRSNCNVSGMTAYAWITPEEPGHLMSFLGLANPRTLRPYPVVRTIRREISVMRGKSASDPPRAGLRHCRGM